MLHKKKEAVEKPELLWVVGLTYYDLDDPASIAIPFDARILGDVEAIKCDGEYFLVPEESTDLVEVVTNNENRVEEHEVLGTRGMLDKYLTPLYDVGAPCT